MCPRPSIPLHAEDVWLERAGRPVLQGVDLRLQAEAVTAVVGPSGSGKTSLLRCLNRLEEPHRGRVTLEGIDIRALPPPDLRRRVGMIFQTPVLFEGGVRANLTYGLERAEEDRMAEALAVAGLDHSFLARESSALSVGQAQRVCIARALLREPKVLLMDEPTSALDKNSRARIEELIRSLAEGGLAVALVTHDLGQAERVADSAVLLVSGRSAAHGSPSRLEKLWPTDRGAPRPRRRGGIGRAGRK